MTSIQINNIFSYSTIMLIGNDLMLTSPNYLTEKTLCFFGKLGKDKFIEYPTILLTKRISSGDTRSTNSKLVEKNIWEEYCKTWGVDKNDYKLMNIINYLININFQKQNSFFNNFEKYIGNTKTISNKNLDYMVNPKLLEHIKKVNNFNTRYLKLKTLS